MDLKTYISKSEAAAAQLKVIRKALAEERDKLEELKNQAKRRGQKTGYNRVIIRLDNAIEELKEARIIAGDYPLSFPLDT